MEFSVKYSWLCYLHVVLSPWIQCAIIYLHSVLGVCVHVEYTAYSIGTFSSAICLLPVQAFTL